MADQDQDQVTLKKLQQEVFDYAAFRLAKNLVDVELDPEHYQIALTRAVELYRQRSSNAVDESYAFLCLQENVQDYYLPADITFVKQLFRRTIGYGAGATEFEPFQTAFLSATMLTAGQSGGLLSYELFTGYQDLVARMFGGFMLFTFNIVTHKLSLVRRPQASGEIVLMHVYNLKPEAHLLTDYRSKAWLKECTYSYAKAMLGEARSKFASISGPQGGSALNGEALKTEAYAEIEKHIESIGLYTTGETPLSFIFG
jgi:hypothetical protein